MLYNPKKFTLVELLIVITIIAVLASMLLPALKRARLMSYSISCKSNLKQIGTGASMYTNDFEGYMPILGYGSGDYSNTVALLINLKYLPFGKVWACPEFKNCDYPDDMVAGKGLVRMLYSSCIHYGYNMNFGGKSTTNSSYYDPAYVKKINSINDPSRKIFWADVQAGLDSPYINGYYRLSNLYTPTFSFGNLAPRALKAVNIFWVDSHISSEKASTSQEAYTDLSSNF